MKIKNMYIKIETERDRYQKLIREKYPEELKKNILEYCSKCERRVGCLLLPITTTGNNCYYFLKEL